MFFDESLLRKKLVRVFNINVREGWIRFGHLFLSLIVPKLFFKSLFLKFKTIIVTAGHLKDISFFPVLISMGFFSHDYQEFCGTSAHFFGHTVVIVMLIVLETGEWYIIFSLKSLIHWTDFLGFRWTDGKPVAYNNWLSGRPYSGNRHFCAGINNNGFWEDLPCYSRFTSMCKLFKGI